MRHVFVSRANGFTLEESPEPTIYADTDVIVKVSVTTICGSDVHLIHGDMDTPWGFALGHEFVGVVHKAGAEVRKFRMGDRVVAPAMVWCGECQSCRRHQNQACERGGIFGSGKGFGDLGGAQAEFVRVPWADNCLSAVPDDVNDAQALAVGDILSTGWSAVKNSVHAPGSTLVVLGAGPVGLSAVHTARLEGISQVIAVDVLPDRLNVAKRLGATHVINPAKESVAEKVMELTGGRGAEAIVDAAGVKGSVDSWSSVAAVGAKVAMVGIPSASVEMPLAALQMKNITIWMGLGNTAYMDTLLQFIQDGVLDPSPIFSEVIPFDNIETGLHEFISRKPGLLKPLITVG
ncbi:chaperonin 10-like protein [Aspergillus bertholletiae]|uniref:Chaperonin 10-like protein n=1 Tax=Aspergillus bertholletiae TaxID=1226010 RepID=A0A5N7BKS9_9EURO|nr:chaperonin 10-like protein [Aspergillus bertholletiae]